MEASSIIQESDKRIGVVAVEVKRTFLVNELQSYLNILNKNVNVCIPHVISN